MLHDMNENSNTLAAVYGLMCNPEDLKQYSKTFQDGLPIIDFVKL
jgi:hypothetical protein